MSLRLVVNANENNGNDGQDDQNCRCNGLVAPGEQRGPDFDHESEAPEHGG